MRILLLTQLTGAILLFGNVVALSQDAPLRILYPSGVHTLDGHLYKPPGAGPFPAVVFNQPSMNSEKGGGQPGVKLAKIFTSQGYAFFVPGRHHAGPEEATLPNQKKLGQSLFLPHERQAANFSAAIRWLKTQENIIATRITVLGEAAGGVSTLFMKDDLGVNGMILISPGTQALRDSAMAAKLKQAVADAKVPIFLIQTQSDPNLLPSEILGPEVAKKGRPNHIKVYPRFGPQTSSGQKFMTEGYPLWQEDVLAFLQSIPDKTVAWRTTN